MSKKLLNQKEQHYADTRKEAEHIVEEAQDKGNLVMHKISEKYNKYGQYFLVDLTYLFATPKEIMEDDRPQDDVVAGQMSLTDVEDTPGELAAEDKAPF